VKTISWITADCFIDTDLPVIAELKNHYRILWQIVISRNGGIRYEDYVSLLIPENGDTLTIEYVREKYRRRDPRMLLSDIRVLKRAKSVNPDFYYVSGFMAPWGLPFIRLLLPVDKVVIACHNVSTPKGADKSKVAELTMGFVLKHFNNIQVFSLNQKAILDGLHGNKNVLCAPHAPSDYGEPSLESTDRKDGIIRFLSFGIIRDYKRIDLLLEAACILYERGFKGFRVKIAGSCPDWASRYSKYIKYPDLFELDIRRIPNEEVADLFAESDYFVMPYQDIAQSGALTVALRYNVPVIVSDIPQFHEFVEDGKTGLYFKSEDAGSLANIMQHALENHDSIYPELKANQREFVRAELSLESIVDKYISFLDKL
jgi:glycosyltransferase involved in cell wall biosynthesis